MNDVILQLIENCEINFDNCYNDTCPIFAECEQWREEHKEYVVLNIGDITDEQLEGIVRYLDENILNFTVLTNDQIDIYEGMTEEDKIKFDNDFQDRILELLQRRINSRRSK